MQTLCLQVPRLATRCLCSNITVLTYSAKNGVFRRLLPEIGILNWLSILGKSPFYSHASLILVYRAYLLCEESQFADQLDPALHALQLQDPCVVQELAIKHSTCSKCQIRTGLVSCVHLCALSAVSAGSQMAERRFACVASALRKSKGTGACRCAGVPVMKGSCGDASLASLLRAFSKSKKHFTHLETFSSLAKIQAMGPCSRRAPSEWNVTNKSLCLQRQTFTTRQRYVVDGKPRGQSDLTMPH